MHVMYEIQRSVWKIWAKVGYAKRPVILKNLGRS